MHGTLFWWVKDPKRRRGQSPDPRDSKSRANKFKRSSFRTDAGGEPVRDWLKSLPSDEDRKRIGEDIKTVEFGWPVGMPACRPLGDGVHEVRTSLPENRIARVLFYIDKKGRMVLLHGFIKKTRKTPDDDLDLARRNRTKHQGGMR